MYHSEVRYGKGEMEDLVYNLRESRETVSVKNPGWEMFCKCWKFLKFYDNIYYKLFSDLVCLFKLSVRTIRYWDPVILYFERPQKDKKLRDLNKNYLQKNMKIFLWHQGNCTLLLCFLRARFSFVLQILVDQCWITCDVLFSNEL